MVGPTAVAATVATEAAVAAAVEAAVEAAAAGATAAAAAGAAVGRADHAGVLAVLAALRAAAVAVAFAPVELPLDAVACHLAHPDRTAARPLLGADRRSESSRETELAADDGGLLHTPPIVADCAPQPSVEYLHASLRARARHHRRCARCRRQAELALCECRGGRDEVGEEEGGGGEKRAAVAFGAAARR